jgi:hypothetical protein
LGGADRLSSPPSEQLQHPSYGATGVRFIAKGKDFYFASWRQVYILDWRDAATREGLDASVLGKRTVLGDHPDGVYVYNILDGSKGLPDAEIRAYAERKQNEDPHGVLCHLTVVRGDGFRSSTLRSMLAGLYMVSRAKYPRKVMGTLEEGAGWMETLSKGGPPWTEQLVQALYHVRRAT